jgi:hypothetical protein
VVDAADPQLAQPVGSLMVPGFAFGVAVEATHAYVAWTTGGPLPPTAPGGLRTVDMSDPVLRWRPVRSRPGRRWTW